MPAPQISTDASGQGQIDLPNSEKKYFGLADNLTSGGKPVTHFSISLNVLKHDGAVVETTGRSMPDLDTSRLPKGNYTVDKIRIGNRTYLRVAANTPFGSPADLVGKLSELTGVKFAVDICIVKEPGPPLGSAPVSTVSIDEELPGTLIKLSDNAGAVQ
jgi:hypothetical protein